MYVIQPPEWEQTRIVGQNVDWRVQTLVDTKDGGKEWTTTNYFTSLHHATGFLYEKALRDKDATATSLEEFHNDAVQIKNKLLKAVKQAVK